MNDDLKLQADVEQVAASRNQLLEVGAVLEGMIAISENGERRTARAPDCSRTSVQNDGMGILVVRPVMD
ncbi:hypothetical protein [Halorubrum sp. CSM-61]|uniref:hypothetical protein n=1 Tax=Halorubrum sp. CSM-61 TaxID=2485838 RepID=UPI000F4C064D|nr:hypothetical protein [Halorubrum sp. CSM-61]